MCVPVSIGFGKMALVAARIEYSAWQCLGEETLNVNLWYLYLRNLASWQRISYRRRPLNGSRYLGLATWIRRNRRDCQRMFIHWNRSIRDIMRSHISRWIVETVKEAYTQADRQYDRVTAHEVRALSASWAYNCQVALSLPDILSAVFGGHLGSSRIRTCATWLVLLRACWDRLASRLYAATATPFRTWRYQLIIR